MEKKLILTFKDESNSKCTVTINSIKESISEKEINSLMDLIVSSKIFQSKKGLLTSKVSAVTIDTTETEYNLTA